MQQSLVKGEIKKDEISLELNSHGEEKKKGMHLLEVAILSSWTKRSNCLKGDTGPINSFYQRLIAK